MKYFLGTLELHHMHMMNYGALLLTFDFSKLDPGVVSNISVPIYTSKVIIQEAPVMLMLFS